MSPKVASVLNWFLVIAAIVLIGNEFFVVPVQTKKIVNEAIPGIKASADEEFLSRIKSDLLEFKGLYKEELDKKLEESRILSLMQQEKIGLLESKIIDLEVQLRKEREKK